MAFRNNNAGIKGEVMNKKLIGNTAWYFLGTAISAIIGFISAPILTRVLSTEVYAQYGMITSFTTLVATFVYLGQDEAFMRYFDRRKEPFWSFFGGALDYHLFCAL